MGGNCAKKCNFVCLMLKGKDQRCFCLVVEAKILLLSLDCLVLRVYQRPLA